VVCVSQGKGDGRSIANDAASDRDWRILCAGESRYDGFPSGQLNLQLLESATAIPLVHGLSDKLKQVDGNWVAKKVEKRVGERGRKRIECGT
jgi:hypothetical protein